ncbi:MAG: thioredoxin fold domain-containing protein [Ignavibacteria bacterium]|nr:thioredoxin fold domain-containing protein [Ignavibacteria bacterium]MCU7501616.1 thioredoxin fold domain-containing protein [Ignavibacteria bacterium]MCU7518544.1 thioredoxin fold domain-containing protein [Ignavibacteria bacterium]
MTENSSIRNEEFKLGTSFSSFSGRSFSGRKGSLSPWFLFFPLVFLLLAYSPLKAQFAGEESHVRLSAKLSENSVPAGGKLRLTGKVSIESSWHINSNKPNEDYLIPTTLGLDKKNNPAKLQISSLHYPAAKNIKFEFSETPVSVYEGEVTVSAEITIPSNTKPGKYPVKLVLNYQSCNNNTCLPPSTAEAELNVNVTPASQGASAQDTASTTSIKSNTPQAKAGDDKAQTSLQASGTAAAPTEGSLSDKLASSGLLLSLVIVFLGGLALNLTPCVYPLVPITIGYFGGQSEGSTRKLFSLGVLYVLGMALTYSLIGVITALSGAVFGTLMQKPIVVLVVVLVLFTLSLSMFGVYEFKLPDSLVAKAGGAKGGYFGAFFMGLTMGIVAAPCIGPFVLGLVTFVGTKGDPYYGFMMFFFLALGLGFPYLLLALFSGKIKSLPRAGMWMEAVKHIFGFILLGMALYFLDPILPKSFAKYVLPVYMILASLYLLLFDKSAGNVKGMKVFKAAFSVLIIAIAVYMLLPEKKSAPEWKYYSDEAYTTSLKSGKPMIIDFFADWCIPCKELDGMTFSNSRVIDESRRFHNYKVDMTKLSDVNESIRNKFKIVGMPTVLIINSKGQEVKRITGFVNAEEFHKLISSID